LGTPLRYQSGRRILRRPLFLFGLIRGLRGWDKEFVAEGQADVQAHSSLPIFSNILYSA
jgi:hypothetical protein